MDALSTLLELVSRDQDAANTSTEPPPAKELEGTVKAAAITKTPALFSASRLWMKKSIDGQLAFDTPSEVSEGVEDSTEGAAEGADSANDSPDALDVLRSIAKQFGLGNVYKGPDVPQPVDKVEESPERDLIHELRVAPLESTTSKFDTQRVFDDVFVALGALHPEQVAKTQGGTKHNTPLSHVTAVSMLTDLGPIAPYPQDPREDILVPNTPPPLRASTELPKKQIPKVHSLPSLTHEEDLGAFERTLAALNHTRTTLAAQHAQLMAEIYWIVVTALGSEATDALWASFDTDNHCTEEADSETDLHLCHSPMVNQPGATFDQFTSCVPTSPLEDRSTVRGGLPEDPSSVFTSSGTHKSSRSQTNAEALTSADKRALPSSPPLNILQSASKSVSVRHPRYTPSIVAPLRAAPVFQRVRLEALEREVEALTKEGLSKVHEEEILKGFE